MNDLIAMLYTIFYIKNLFLASLTFFRHYVKYYNILLLNIVEFGFQLSTITIAFLSLD